MEIESLICITPNLNLIVTFFQLVDAHDLFHLIFLANVYPDCRYDSLVRTILSSVARGRLQLVGNFLCTHFFDFTMGSMLQFQIGSTFCRSKRITETRLKNGFNFRRRKVWKLDLIRLDDFDEALRFPLLANLRQFEIIR